MVALSLSLLLNNYPNEKKGLALALWAMTVVVAPIFGPILGGYLTDNYSWPWIFYINVPVGMLAAVITWTLLRKRETKTVQGADRHGRPGAAGASASAACSSCSTTATTRTGSPRR